MNFLNEDAVQHAEQRAVEVAREGGTLDPDHLFENLLSSMLMCFNLFGALRSMEGNGGSSQQGVRSRCSVRRRGDLRGTVAANLKRPHRLRGTHRLPD